MADDPLVSLVANSPGPVTLYRLVRDADGRPVDADVEAANPEALDFLAPVLVVADPVGRRLRDVLRPADADVVVAELAEVDRTGRAVERPWDLDAPVPDADGTAAAHAVTRVPVDGDRVVSWFRDLAEHRALEDAAAAADDRARRAEDALTAGLNASPDVFVIASLEPDGGLQFHLVNAAGMVLGQRLAHIDGEAPRLEPDNPLTGALRPYVSIALRSGAPIQGRLGVDAAGGGVLNLEFAVAPLPDGRCVITVRDVSDAVAMEQELAESLQLSSRARRLLHIALDSSPYAFTIYRVHRDDVGQVEAFTFEFLNRPAVIGGADVRNWVGRDVRDMYPTAEHEDLLRQLVDVADTGVPVREVIDSVDESGAPASVEVMLTRVDDERVVGLRWDVTERVQAGRVLAEARDAAIAASRAKSDFLATITHEIRTPLTSIVGAADLLLTTSLDESQRELVERQRDSADVLLAILSDILDFSKIEAGQMRLEDVPFELTSTWERTVALFEDRASSKGLSLSATVADDVPAWVRGDPVRLQQVLMNLLSNAVKFTGSGSVTATLDAGPATEPGTVALRVAVTDTGIGLSDEARARLFQPFHQAETSTTRRFGGTGLGLSIVSRLVSAMGGGIEVDSVPGVGSTFRFFVVVHRAQAPDDGAATGAAPDHGLDGLRVLLVEDNDVNRHLVSRMLTRLGAVVATAADGEQAVSAVLEERPDVVLMDVSMPRLDGLTATRIIRDLERAGRLGRTVVVALTANATHDAQAETRDAGMDGFLTKPVRLDELRSALHRFRGVDP